MKTLIIVLITFYQKFLSPILHGLVGVRSACRYPISCSAYAKNVILEKGAVVGSILSIKRLFSCQPF